MIVKLRNKDGQFCALEQFCADEPMVEVSPARGISYAAKELPAMREALLRLELLLEVVKAFDLRERCNCISSGRIMVHINKYGSAYYCLPTKNTTHAEMIAIVKAWIAEAEALAAKWQATEYEVNDK